MAAPCITIIQVGGESTSNFRALGSTPAPLFPLAGHSLLHHPVAAAAALPGMRAVFVLGFYPEPEFAAFCAAASAEHGVPVRYLCETRGLGSAGGMHQFREQLLAEKPAHLFLMNCDVCCAFPLADLLAAHVTRPGALGTLLTKRVAASKASECGEVVADAATGELLHYTERPETYVSDVVDMGVYVFSPALLDVLAQCVAAKEVQPPARDVPHGFVRLGADVLATYAGKRRLYVHETTEFWERVKAPGMTLRACELYLEHYRATAPELLAAGGPQLVGNCYVHPTAVVDPSAKLGPNVSVSQGAVIGPGARLSNCIVLDGVVVGAHAVVQHAIIGWASKLGAWARVQASGDHAAKFGVAILGEDVTVADEVVLVGCVVLPHKEIKASVTNEVIL